MDFKKQDKTGQVGKEIAAYALACPAELRTVVVAEVDNAIVTWKNKRRTWEYWRHDVDTTEWKLIGSFASAAKAKTRAEDSKAELIQVENIRSMGDVAIVVIAEWLSPYHGDNPIEVLCSSPVTAESVASVFNSIGCSTALRAA
jgi:hypothetical protein